MIDKKTALAPEKRLQMKKSTTKKKGHKKWDKGDCIGMSERMLECWNV